MGRLFCRQPGAVPAVIQEQGASSVAGGSTLGVPVDETAPIATGWRASKFALQLFHPLFRTDCDSRFEALSMHAWKRP
jgi:hypothetical protein